MKKKTISFAKVRFFIIGLTASFVSLPVIGSNTTGNTDHSVSYSMENAAISSSYALLGEHYKTGVNMDQNYAKALETFKRGAEAGSAECMHQLGHMYFKGLGCQQSYNKAFKYFTEAMEKDYTPSKYMAAICYRNGYGTDANYMLANKMLEELSQEGYNPASKELEYTNGESINMFTDNYDKSIFTQPAIEGQEINGAFMGDLVIYDDSRQHILNVIPANVFISQSGNRISGSFKIENDSYPFYASVSNNTADFSNTSLLLESRYCDVLLDYNLVNAQMYHDGKKLCFNLNTKLAGLNEPGHPMYLFTHKGTYEDIQMIAENSLYMSCSTISSNQMQFDYEVPVNTGKLSIAIYNTAGEILNAINDDNVQAGMKSSIMDFTSKDNTLIIKYQSDDISFSKKIMIK